jgi:chromosomal replication initiation ATPase DnaA
VSRGLVSISNSILDELLITVESIGVGCTIKSLQEARIKTLILGNIDIDNILKFVSEVSNVSVERILHGNDRSDERKMAVALSVHFIKEELKYSYNDIKKIFNKDAAGLHRYKRLIESIPNKPKTSFDKTLNELTKKVELLIIREKNNKL